MSFPLRTMCVLSRSLRHLLLSAFGQATTEFNRLVRQNKNTIQYPRFCKLQQAFYDHQDTLRERALGGNKQVCACVRARLYVRLPALGQKFDP